MTPACTSALPRKNWSGQSVSLCEVKETSNGKRQKAVGSEGGGSGYSCLDDGRPLVRAVARGARYAAGQQQRACGIVPPDNGSSRTYRDNERVSMRGSVRSFSRERDG